MCFNITKRGINKVKGERSKVKAQPDLSGTFDGHLCFLRRFQRHANVFAARCGAFFTLFFVRFFRHVPDYYTDDLMDSAVKS
jgi:hypothetical protein